MKKRTKSLQLSFFTAAITAALVVGPVSIADTTGDDTEKPSYARPYEPGKDDINEPINTADSDYSNLPTQAGCATGGTCLFYLNNSWTGGNADLAFTFGVGTDTPLAGDWNGDDTDTIGVRRGVRFLLRDENSGGPADYDFKYGRETDEIYIGDWDGNKTDTLAVRRGYTYFVNNELIGGNADVEFKYGREGDETFVGDWDGDGVDTLTVRRGHTFYGKNTLDGGNEDFKFKYGRDGDEIHVGDWDGDGIDTFAVRRGHEWFIKNNFESGNAETVIKYGRDTDQPIVGDWDGDGTDTPGVHRPPPPPPEPEPDPEPDPDPPGPTLPSQVPVMVYGTLRTGQPAYDVVAGRFNLNVVSRAPSLELWVTDHPFPSYPVWPWALPGSTGMTGEMLFFPQERYSEEVFRLDRWEGYTPGGDPNEMNYIRDKAYTIHDKNAWVYIATPWRQTFARNYGTKVTSGDITRF